MKQKWVAFGFALLLCENILKNLSSILLLTFGSIPLNLENFTVKISLGIIYSNLLKVLKVVLPIRESFYRGSSILCLITSQNRSFLQEAAQVLDKSFL